MACRTGSLQSHAASLRPSPQCICTRCCVCARPASPCATGPSPSTSPTALHFLARHACLRRCLVGDGSALGLAGAFVASAGLARTSGRKLNRVRQLSQAGQRLHSAGGKSPRSGALQQAEVASAIQQRALLSGARRQRALLCKREGRGTHWRDNSDRGDVPLKVRPCVEAQSGPSQNPASTARRLSKHASPPPPPPAGHESQWRQRGGVHRRHRGARRAGASNARAGTVPAGAPGHEAHFVLFHRILAAAAQGGQVRGLGPRSAGGRAWRRGRRRRRAARAQSARTLLAGVRARRRRPHHRQGHDRDHGDAPHARRVRIRR